MSRHPFHLPLWLTLLLILAACGPNAGDGGDGGDGGASPAGTPAGESPGATGAAGGLEASGDIFAFGVSYETSDEIAQGRIDHFRGIYPDVNVELSESGFDSQGFLTALQSDDPPDVVRVPRDRLGTYVARGVIEPLDDCIARAGVDMSVFREAAVNQVTIDGSVYAMPEFFWVTNWLVDNDVFEAAGLDAATFDFSDWDAIAAANQAILERDVLVGIDPKVSDGDRFPIWVWANGGQMLSEDGRESLLDTPEVAEALEFTRSLIEAHGGHTAFLDARGEAGADFFGSDNQFVIDQEGAFPMQQWYLNVLAGASPDTAITARAFQVRGSGEPITYAEGDALAVTADSDNKDAACAFVTTMVSADAWIAAQELRAAGAEEEGGIQTGTSTGNRDADDVIFGELANVSDNPIFQAALDAYLDTLDAAVAMPPSPAGEEFQQAWQTAVTAVLNGEMEAAEALAAADEEAQAAIDAAAE